MSRILVTALFLGTLTACGSSGPSEPTPTAQESSPASAGGQAELEALRSHVADLAARAEHDAQRVVVRHLLVGFAGAPGMRVQRSREEAELLTARLFAEAGAGADFAALVAEHSDDSPEGVYTMVSTSPPPRGAYRRSDMVPAFGNAGWRLEVGEIGVVAHDPQQSPFGWHIVERLE